MRTRQRRGRDERQDEFEERVVRIDRTRKTVKGGRVSSVRVCAAVGDGKGSVGLGVGKAREIPEAIEKAMKRARENMIRIPMDGYTIPHQVEAKVGGAIILLRPASRGTGVVAGGATRQILEVSGIRDILTKSLGSGNVFNRAHACFKALKILFNPADIAAERDISVEDMLGRAVEDPYKKAEEEAKAAAEAAEAAKVEAAAQAEAKRLEEAQQREAEALAEIKEQQAAEAAEAEKKAAEEQAAAEAASAAEAEKKAAEEAATAEAEPAKAEEAEDQPAAEVAVEDTMTESLTDLFVSTGDEDDEDE
jgi:small subunit ribosomal protein S5